jgi:hypothetical protein
VTEPIMRAWTAAACTTLVRVFASCAP